MLNMIPKHLKLHSHTLYKLRLVSPLSSSDKPMRGLWSCELRKFVLISGLHFYNVCILQCCKKRLNLLVIKNHSNHKMTTKVRYRRGDSSSYPTSPQLETNIRKDRTLKATLFKQISLDPVTTSVNNF